MISMYDTIAISLIACLCVLVFLVILCPMYWKTHKISILGTMGIATFAAYMNNILEPVVILISVIVMLFTISVCDALYAHKREERRRNTEAHKEEV